ncbi:ROK family transcriptional regulator [Roseibium sp. SCP14]|uniref:ROK family transcriptional regulator n=1 Tax=Roseibium sp. SCP14 TaxID=3141375 RepID=UPI003337B626
MGIHLGQILSMLRDEGPLSRAELARRTMLSATALTKMTSVMLERGCVVETKLEPSTQVGRPPTNIEIVFDAFQVIGIHVGAAEVHIALTNLAGKPLHRTSFRFDSGQTSVTDVIDRIAAKTEELIGLSDVFRSQILGIGVGVPGPVDRAGRRNILSINADWTDVPFADELERRLNLPVTIEHNVSAMALAEARYGIGRKSSALLYVYLRSGLGAGLVVDGIPFRPGGHGAVELGHIRVVEQGETCSCGATGCLETFLSERALMQAAGREDGDTSNLLAAVEKNNEAWQTVLHHFTGALSSAINLLSPDRIVLGGHFAEAPDSFLEHLRSTVPGQILPHMREALCIERSSLGYGGSAIGGASVALDQFFYSGAFQ